MKVIIPLLLLLILGRLSALSGLREKTLGKLARGAVCIVRHKNSNEFGDCSYTSDPDWRGATLPFQTEGIDMTITHHMEKKLYDNVPWDRTCRIQVYYVVESTSNYTATKTMFRDVQIPELLDVSIRYRSLLGGVPETLESSTISKETVDQSESDTIISPVVMACMSLVLATGVCSYLAHISV